MGRLEEALSHYTEALPLRRQFDNILAVAQSLTSIGMVYARLGEPQKALEYYEQALPLARTGGDLRQEAFALKNLGWLYAQNGDYRQSAGYAERALQLLREAGDRQGEADALNLSGVSWDHLGESGKAFDFLRQSLAVWREVGNRYGEGQALHNLGVQYSNLFELDLAQDNYLQSLAIWRAIGNKSEEANTLNALGLLFRQNREVDKSRENYEQALAIYRRQGDRRGQALVLNNLGFNRLSERDAAQAHVNFGAALSLAREIGNRETEAISKYGMALARIEQGDNSKAEQDLSDSLRLSRAASFPALETGVLYEMARIAQAAGEYEKSQRLYTETIQAKEAWLTRLSRQTFNVSVFRDQFNVYSDYADLLIRMSRLYPGKGFEAQAFEISERGRARRLLDLLAESNVDVRQGAPADLLDRERSLRWQISAKENLRQQGAGAPRAEAQQAKAELEIHDLIAQYREAQGRIRESSPGYAALTRPTPLRLPEIQKLLDNDTVLLEYLLKKDRSMLWAVTQNSISYFDLPRQGEIETATQRVFELLRAARPSFQPDETPQRKSQRLARVSADYAAASAALSRMLLGPAAAQLGNKRLVIVPDGVLSYLPFNALPAPSAAKAPGAQPAPPLIARHEVVSAPSATVLTVLRQQQQGRAPASKSIAILADPVFSRQDARLAAGLGAVAKPGAGDQNPPPGSPPKSEMARFSPLDRSAIENDFHGFQRLRFSREEAEAIASFAPPDRRLLALDFDANLKTASHETLDQYRIVHFATHGLINAKNPELSGLVLSLYDPEGKEQDGFLRLFEIYNLRLNADLVVMSGCKTALGKEIRGEGLVGLTCGFMYAGAPRVVASLWSVDDQATARLMKRFYQKMLGEGATAAAALRAAQIEMWKEQPRAAPYAWAAFTLQGEWR
jgi:CHAT domain-containing protein/tetratricopeptide (TPR) repeat protein